VKAKVVNIGTVTIAGHAAQLEMIRQGIFGSAVESFLQLHSGMSWTEYSRLREYLQLSTVQVEDPTTL
jgi:hypothetical protein